MEEEGELKKGEKRKANAVSLGGQITGDTRLYAGSGTEIFFIQQATGEVGIGTTNPSEKLTVSGGAIIGATYSSLGITAPLNGLLVQGNVGIGTTLPQYTLDVNGSFNASTFYISGTQVTANADELNILDGALINTTELNLLQERTGTLVDSNNF